LFSFYDLNDNGFRSTGDLSSWDPTEPYDRYKTLKGIYNQPLKLSFFNQMILNGLFVEPSQKVDMLFAQTVSF